MYLGSSVYRIHGHQRSLDHRQVRLLRLHPFDQEDVADLFSRVDIGTKVVVLPKNAPHIEARATETDHDLGPPGSGATASCGDDLVLRAPGDEPFDPSPVLSTSARAGDTMNWTSAFVGRVRALLAPLRAPVAAVSALFGVPARAVDPAAVRQ